MPKRIVGRGGQLTELRRLLDAATERGSQLVLIGGDAGGGKTTLVQALAAEVSGRSATVELGECLPVEGLAYAPISRLLRRMIDNHGADRVVEWAGSASAGLSALIPDVISPPAATDIVRLQVYEAVARVIEQASRVRPLILIIEDLHWADQSTRHLLTFIARALTDARVMIIMTYRSDELTRQHPVRGFLAELGRLPNLQRIDLPRLNRGEVAEMLTSLLDRDPDSAMIELISQRSEGVPFFIEELARSRHTSAGLPDSLRDALTVRIQTLPEESQTILQIMAIAGPRVDHEVLAAVVADECPTVDLDQELRRAIDAQVLRVDGSGYAFGHALLQESVDEEILPGQRTRLHARYAAVIMDLPGLPEEVRARALARHWYEARELEHAFRWAYRCAVSKGTAPAESLLMYERVLELWDRVPEPEQVAGSRSQVGERAALAALAAGDPERSMALVKETLNDADPDDHERQARLLILKCRQLINLMRPGCVTEARRTLDLIPVDPPSELLGSALYRLGVALKLEEGRDADALAVAQDLIKVGEAIDSPLLQADGRNLAGSALVGLGDEEAGLAELARAEPLSQGDPETMIRYYINMSDAQYAAGRFAESVATAQTGIAAADPHGLGRTMGVMLAGNAASPTLALGDWAEAQRLIDRALRLDPSARFRAQVRLVHGWLLLWTGDLEGAEHRLMEYRSLIVEDSPAPQYMIRTIELELWLGCWRNDPERAWWAATYLLQNWDRFHVGTVVEALAAAARAARLLDGGTGERVATIRNHFDRTVPTTPRRHWAPTIEAELTGSTEDWRHAWQQSEADGGHAVIRPYVGLRFAESLLADRPQLADRPRRDQEANEVIMNALQAADQRGATTLSVPLRDLASRIGAAPKITNSPLDILTRREREVLDLLATGRTNGEIARELAISTKTASVHVSNILTKLGVANRGEASALAHRLGSLA